ncbi:MULTISPECIES: acyl-CoA dehydrogenase [Hoeflea]|uniref:Acyl-CoA dehydrogenase n=1 Tax=Hoeflea alexandrii TaxID=288436 RepID=A0ABT1CTQ6_9HYPH|nr:MULTISPECIES: acyl-CoA dehydrogenase [Hoeflea]MCO6409586.1 acyl-CoA dehydrogenase [Hoeflea alexandrii]MCY0152607.1 acyl-CoA dehydrogenase [Hoeflea alexandrii]VVT21351.1 3-methylmercaptopropionyl-CoA dehydrogenase [Hoeflea sp. EC-HK425]
MYRAPVDEIAHTLKSVAGLRKALETERFGDLGEDLVDAILAEAGRFSSDEIAPLNEIGDKHGAVLKDGAVTTPPGWKDLYKNWIDGGWNGLTGPEEFGGQGLPMLLSVAALEMWNSGSLAFGIGPTLTMGAVEALEKHASDELKARYLEKLVTGEWMGTMNLTEPQAGSDLNALKARAEPNGDGTYRIYGQKIYITYGEHDFTDNIVHLVLARLPDAPAGTRGISLFLVPKFFVGDDGSLGERNDVFCSGLEHKLGIHASPTCTMIYGDGKFGDSPGAIGWLIGEENKGLACMFTMMNNARLAVGMQGVAIAETAYQKALAYARERTQGRAPGHKGEGMSPIIEHPDVARMLMTMKALTQGARAICYSCAEALDMARVSEGEEAKAWSERASLITPIAKAFSTDIGLEVASLGVQVHGGMGFIEETGAARLLRDARIAPIYEGTNGIQAIDLVMRKLPLSGGATVAAFIADFKADAEAARASNAPALEGVAEKLDQAIANLESVTAYMQSALSEGRQTDALTGATPYLRLFGLTATTAMLVRGALADTDAPEAQGRAALARFAAASLAPETNGLAVSATAGATALEDAAAALA